MSAIITRAPTAAQMTVPSMAAFISSLPGSYQRTDESAPSRAAPYTRNFVMREF